MMTYIPEEGEIDLDKLCPGVLTVQIGRLEEEGNSMVILADLQRSLARKYWNYISSSELRQRIADDIDGMLEDWGVQGSRMLTYRIDEEGPGVRVRDGRLLSTMVNGPHCIRIPIRWSNVHPRGLQGQLREPWRRKGHKE